MKISVSKKSKTFKQCLLAAAAFAACAGVATAAPFSAKNFSFTQEINFIPSRSAENAQPGNVEQTQVKTRLAYQRATKRLGAGGFFRTGIDYAHTDVNFSESAPFGTYRSLGLDVFYARPLADSQRKWSAFGNARWEMAAERDAQLEKGLSFNLLAGAKYQQSETLAWSFGLMYSTQLQQDNNLHPIISAEWAITPQLTLVTSNGAELRFKPRSLPGTEFGSYLKYASTQFALEGNDRAADHRYIPLGLKAQHQFTPAFTVGAHIEARFSERYKIYQGGVRTGKFGVGTGLGLGVKGTLQF